MDDQKHSEIFDKLRASNQKFDMNIQVQSLSSKMEPIEELPLKTNSLETISNEKTNLLFYSLMGVLTALLLIVSFSLFFCKCVNRVSFFSFHT